MDEAPETTGAPGPEEVPAQAEAEAASVDAAARVDTDAPPAPTVDSTATAEPALTGEVPPPLQLAVDAAPPAPELPRARIPAPAAPAAEFAAAPVKRPQLSPSATQPAADEPAELPFDAPRAGLYQITFTLQPDGYAASRHARARPLRPAARCPTAPPRCTTAAPRSYTHKGEYAPNMTLGEVAVALDNELHIPAQSLVFSLHGRQLPHSTRLSDHGLSLDVPNALSMAVQVGVQKPAPTDYVMPDVITVEVTFEDAPPRVIHVRAPSATPHVPSAARALPSRAVIAPPLTPPPPPPPPSPPCRCPSSATCRCAASRSSAASGTSRRASSFTTPRRSRCPRQSASTTARRRRSCETTVTRRPLSL